MKISKPKYYEVKDGDYTIRGKEYSAVEWVNKQVQGYVQDVVEIISHKVVYDEKACKLVSVILYSVRL